MLFVMYTLYVWGMYTYFVSRKTNLCKEITSEGNQFNFATSCKYFGHVISNNLSANNLSEESDIQAEVTLVYQEKCLIKHSFLFYCCKISYLQLKLISRILLYNNSFRILNITSMNNTVNGFHAIHTNDPMKCGLFLVATGSLYVNCCDKHDN